MKKLSIFLSLLCWAAIASPLPDLELSLPSNALFDSNKQLRMSMEVTGIHRDEMPVDDYVQVSKKMTTSLMNFFPNSHSLTHKSKNTFVFNDGSAGKPNWKIEIDGSLNRHPILEITTPDVLTKKVEIFDQVFELLSEIPVVPNKEVGGGHVRVKIKKNMISPRQLKSFLNLYYSYQDILVFSFRSEKRSHRTAAPMMGEKAHWDSFAGWLLKGFGKSDTVYGDYRAAQLEEPTMQALGGWLKRRGILFDLEARGYDKYFAFNIARLYSTYKQRHKKSLKFEFRFFDAPTSKRELRLHLLVVKALFQKAMNNQVKLYRKDWGKMRLWRSNKAMYQRDLKGFLADLGLDYSKYTYLVEQNSY
ncbi:MAG: hypothetical protein HN509_01910 [Halobacteriovoraceae bacterium]|jgi:hypothetical protein|nr:hypothetical protein [Halobacteriovoraceae bacterium]